MFDLIIIGAGMAGLTCALYAGRSNLSVLVIEQQNYGGQILTTPEIENYPGLENVTGFDLMETVYRQAVTNFSTPFVVDTITSVSLGGAVKQVKTATETYEAKSVVIATGAKHRKLGCPGEAEFSGRGVSYCATCDAAFFRGKTVAVIGGGNTALQDALYLGNLCKQVYLVHRRDTFRADPITVTAALEHPAITPIYHAVCDRIYGGETGTVTGITLSFREEQRNEELPLDGVFIAVGVDPDTALFAEEITLDDGGYIKAGEDCRTSLPGVFAAGDVRTKEVRQLVTAAADGAVCSQLVLEELALKVTQPAQG